LSVRRRFVARYRHGGGGETGGKIRFHDSFPEQRAVGEDSRTMLCGGREQVQQRSRQVGSLLLRGKQRGFSGQCGGPFGRLGAAHHQRRQFPHQHHFGAWFRLLQNRFSEESPDAKPVVTTETAHRPESRHKRRNVTDPVKRVLHIRALATRAVGDRFFFLPCKQRFVCEVSK
jgi:hypothetical protein